MTTLYRAADAVTVTTASAETGRVEGRKLGDNTLVVLAAGSTPTVPTTPTTPATVPPGELLQASGLVQIVYPYPSAPAAGATAPTAWVEGDVATGNASGLLGPNGTIAADPAVAYVWTVETAVTSRLDWEAVTGPLMRTRTTGLGGKAVTVTITDNAGGSRTLTTSARVLGSAAWDTGNGANVFGIAGQPISVDKAIKPDVAGTYILEYRQPATTAKILPGWLASQKRQVIAVTASAAGAAVYTVISEGPVDADGILRVEYQVTANSAGVFPTYIYHKWTFTPPASADQIVYVVRPVLIHPSGAACAYLAQYVDAKPNPALAPEKQPPAGIFKRSIPWKTDTAPQFLAPAHSALLADTGKSVTVMNGSAAMVDAFTYPAQSVWQTRHLVDIKARLDVGASPTINLAQYNLSIYDVSTDVPQTTIIFDDCQHKMKLYKGYYVPADGANPATSHFLNHRVAAYMVASPSTDGHAMWVCTNADGSVAIGELWKFHFNEALQPCATHGGYIPDARNNPGLYPQAFGVSASGRVFAQVALLKKEMNEARDYMWGLRDKNPDGTVTPLIAGRTKLPRAQYRRPYGIIKHPVYYGTAHVASWRYVGSEGNRSDGAYTDPGYPWEGGRFIINPALDPLADHGKGVLTDTEVLMTCVGQEYGFVLCDKAGSMAICAEYLGPNSDESWTDFIPAGEYSYNLLKRMPWTDIRVIDPRWDGVATQPGAVGLPFAEAPVAAPDPAVPPSATGLSLVLDEDWSASLTAGRWYAQGTDADGSTYGQTLVNGVADDGGRVGTYFDEQAIVSAATTGGTGQSLKLRVNLVGGVYKTGMVSSRDPADPTNTTKGTRFPRWGRQEIRFRAPHGQGIWGAIWDVGPFGAGDVEHDLFEAFNNNPGMGQSTVHRRVVAGGTTLTNQGTVVWPWETPQLSDGSWREPGWHTLISEVVPLTSSGAVGDLTASSSRARFREWFDGVLVREWIDEQAGYWSSLGTVDQFWAKILQLQIGGKYTGHPTDPVGYSRGMGACLLGSGTAPNACATSKAGSTLRPYHDGAYLEIDRVRVWKAVVS